MAIASSNERKSHDEYDFNNTASARDGFRGLPVDEGLFNTYNHLCAEYECAVLEEYRKKILTVLAAIIPMFKGEKALVLEAKLGRALLGRNGQQE